MRNTSAVTSRRSDPHLHQERFWRMLPQSMPLMSALRQRHRKSCGGRKPIQGERVAIGLMIRTDLHQIQMVHCCRLPLLSTRRGVGQLPSLHVHLGRAPEMYGPLMAEKTELPRSPACSSHVDTSTSTSSWDRPTLLHEGFRHFSMQRRVQSNHRKLHRSSFRPDCVMGQDNDNVL